MKDEDLTLASDIENKEFSNDCALRNVCISVEQCRRWRR